MLLQGYFNSKQATDVTPNCFTLAKYPLKNVIPLSKTQNLFGVWDESLMAINYVTFPF
jgi:hypothetical protein